MKDKIQELIDHHEIIRVLSEYCHACDRCDADLLGSVYAVDSWDDHGVDQAPGPEFAVVMAGRVAQETDALSHFLGQSLVEIEGPTARAETYFIAVQLRKKSDGTPLCEQLGGRYVDCLERSEGRWLIKHRTTLRDWSISHEVKDDFFVLQHLTPGKRDRSDPGVALLGIAHRP